MSHQEPQDANDYIDFLHQSRCQDMGESGERLDEYFETLKQIQEKFKDRVVSDISEIPQETKNA